jgi:hypothetical protein
MVWVIFFWAISQKIYPINVKTNTGTFGDSKLVVVKMSALGASVYRRLLRARNVPFKGDVMALNKSREAIRQGVIANCNERNPEKIGELVVHIQWRVYFPGFI